ncbi:MAG: hypothetical protein VKO21_07145 [Candidatus Sericytochromatia bacterium]|nr:hypothetical protein [Candidatus Sericytochromatia bacterium]
MRVAPALVPPIPLPTRPPAVAAGGLSVAPGAKLQVDETVLGFLPVKLDLDMGDLLAGKHGRDFRFSFLGPDVARVEGVASYAFFKTRVDQQLRVQGGRLVQDMAVHLGEDQKISVEGNLKVFGWTLPFRTKLEHARTSASTFNFRIESLQVGQRSHLTIPKPIVAFLATFLLGAVARLQGVRAVSTDTVALDVDSLAVPTQAH